MCDIEVAVPKNNDGLQFSSIQVKDEYRAEWNMNSSLHDFMVLTMNGVPVSNTLYRRGGAPIGKPGDAFFTCIKHVEDEYDDSITTDLTRKKHLSGFWCVINSKGQEVHVSENKHMSKMGLIRGTCIYYESNRYYNGHDNSFYGYADDYLQSEKYLFLHSKVTVWKFEDLKSDYGVGVLQIDKVTGECVNIFK